MKNKIYPIIMLALLVGFTSCKKDNQTSAQISNSVSYDGTNYNLVKGAYVDYQTLTLYGTTATHNNYEFFVTDGNFVVDANNSLKDITGKVALDMDMYSAGTGAFKTGTYTYVSDANDSSLSNAQRQAKYENKNVFLYGIFVTGTTANTSLGSSGTPLEVKSGTVTVEGTKPNYKLIYDLVLTNDKTVKGSFSGNFTLVKE